MSQNTVNINVTPYAILQKIMVDLKKFEQLGIKY